ncbi:MAG: tRNA uridine-5-carboxymethylaminomethyl(34) synthesis GTPase MnmE [Pseudomonadota bacterium]|nr:tRNA uridine-5-carboxymethylaminomethyl(34) synthesis GTPase MnmE [Pseudomonadota bacterium]
MRVTVNSRSMVNTAAADPIVAIATGPGRGGIGIVRVSGASVAPIMEAVLGARASELVPRCALYSRFIAGDGAEIDHGIALYFPAPHSYTGENVLELQGHGGPVVLRMLLARCLQAGRTIGLRIAQPGEFTQRAFLNDRLDLAQAEAVADLIDATTESAARAAVRSLAGEFSRRAHALTSALIELRVLVEATLDFPEEELDFLQESDAAGRLAVIRNDLDQLLKQAQQGALLRDGLNVVLVGAPNVGKSSLMNTLAGADIAIVTAIPGTTRDRIEQQINVDGIPLNVIDTAGLREAADEVEQLGIARTLAEIERADVVVHLVDATQSVNDAGVLERVSERIGRAAPLLTVINKIDLVDAAPRVEGKRVYLSAKTGAGVDLLRDELKRVAGWEQETSGESVFLARARHLRAMEVARDHLALAAQHAAQSDLQLDLFAEELRLAGNSIGEITGAVSADDLLGVIFSRFCIGK